MLFAFGFSGEDISDDDSTNFAVKVSHSHSFVSEGSSTSASQPQFHRLQDLLDSLKNVRLSFDSFETPKGNFVYRRQLFDVKHQVMSEEGDDANEVHNILIGNSSDEVDVRKNVYEGGFKLWECSYDLVDKIQELYENKEIEKYKCLLELGCGTALPTCYLLMLMLRSECRPQPASLIFSDFNVEVLRLVTLPNILIHYASTLTPETLNELLDTEVPLNNDEILLTPALLKKFTSNLAEKGLKIEFISGAWGHEFLNLVAPFSPDLVLTSETIYSPESIPLVLMLLVNLFSKLTAYLGLVAAKQYYFGVGGSVKAFLDDLHSKMPETMKVETISDSLGLLKREVLQLRPCGN